MPNNWTLAKPKIVTGKIQNIARLDFNNVKERKLSTKLSLHPNRLHPDVHCEYLILF